MRDEVVIEDCLHDLMHRPWWVPVVAHVDGGGVPPALDLESLGAVIRELNLRVPSQEVVHPDYGPSVGHSPDSKGGDLRLAEMILRMNILSHKHHGEEGVPCRGYSPSSVSTRA